MVCGSFCEVGRKFLYFNVKLIRLTFISLCLLVYLSFLLFPKPKYKNCHVKSLLELLDVPLMSELFHIRLLLIVVCCRLFLLAYFSLMVADQFLQLLYSQLVQSQLLLLVFQNQQLLFLLQSLLLKLSFDHMNLVVPCFLRLFSLFLQFCDLFVELTDHLRRDGLLGWFLLYSAFLRFRLLLFFGFFDFLLHFLDFGLFGQVKLMILSQITFIFDQSLREDSALFFCLGNIFFETLDFVFILMVVSDEFEGFGLLLLDFHEGVFLILQGLKFLLQIF
jgi:hypothetical protein